MTYRWYAADLKYGRHSAGGPMGSGEIRLRREVVTAVLRHAEQAPDAPLPFHEIPGATNAFGHPTELWLALHRRWTTLLTGRLGCALDDDSDPVTAVADAWRELAADQPGLRRLLDTPPPTRNAETRAAQDHELRLLARSAGLAELGEPAEEVAAAGAALLCLVRGIPQQRRTSGTGLRRLATSA